jgi:hypothetical protein
MKTFIVNWFFQFLKLISNNETISMALYSISCFLKMEEFKYYPFALTYSRSAASKCGQQDIVSTSTSARTHWKMYLPATEMFTQYNPSTDKQIHSKQSTSVSRYSKNEYHTLAL